MSGTILDAEIREKAGQLPCVDFLPTTIVGTDLKCQEQWLPGRAPSLGSLAAGSKMSTGRGRGT